MGRNIYSFMITVYLKRYNFPQEHLNLYHKESVINFILLSSIATVNTNSLFRGKVYQSVIKITVQVYNKILIIGLIRDFLVTVRSALRATMVR